MNTTPFANPEPTITPLYNAGLTQFTGGAGTATLSTLPQLSFQGQNPFTIEVWLYLDALVDTMNIVSCQNEFTLQTKGSSLWVARAGQANPMLAQNLFQEHTWYYVAVTFDGINMTLYLNGTAISQQSVTDSGASTTGNPLVVGGGFYGQIDSCRIWNVAVNAIDIAQNQWGDYAKNTTGLLAQVDFTASPPIDTSGNGVNTTLSTSGVSFYNYTAATRFTDNSFADPYNDGSINPGGTSTDFSVLAWVYPATFGADQYIFTNGPQESNAGMTLYVNAAGNICFQVGDSTLLVSAGTLQTQQWYYLGVTWTAASTTGQLYINGVADASVSTMTLGSTYTEGVPLLGALASIHAKLPVSTFQGYIQNLSVWKTALAIADVQTYMKQDPQDAPNCIADYNLAIAPPQNVSNFNPVGLVAGAQLSTWQQSTGSNQLPLRQRPLAMLSEPINSDIIISDEQTQTSCSVLDEILNDLLTADLPRAHAQALHDENVQRAVRDVKNNQYNGIQGMEIVSLTDGTTRLLVTQNGTTEIAYEGGLNECTVWIATFIAAIAGGLFTAFGFTLNLSKWAKGFTTFLGTRINNIGIAPQLVAIFNGGVTVNSIYKSIKLLHEFSLLMPLAKLGRQLLTSSIGVWAFISVAARILLIMSPAAPLEIAWFVAQLAYSIHSITTAWEARPANCPS